MFTPGWNSCLQNVSSLIGLSSKDLHKLDIEPYSFHSSPSKEHQDEVVEEGSTQTTQHRNTCHMASNHEKDVETSKWDTHVQYNLCVSTSPEFTKIVCAMKCSLMLHEWTNLEQKYVMMRAARQSKETPVPMYVITDKAKAASGFIGWSGFRSLKILYNPNWSKYYYWWLLTKSIPKCPIWLHLHSVWLSSLLTALQPEVDHAPNLPAVESIIS